MMRKFLLGVVGIAVMASALHAQDKDLAGNWQGTLAMGNGIRAVIKISKADGGSWKAQLFNVDQPGSPIAIPSIIVQGSSVSFPIKPLDATYEGTLNPDGNSIAGNVTTNGQPHALNLTRVSEENTWAIPAPPKKMPADAKPKFDVVTVKPTAPDFRGKLFTVRGRHVMTLGTNMSDLVTFAYGLHAKQLVGAPDWFGTDKFDIDGVPDVEGDPSSDQLKLLIQDALTQRFGLKFHRDKRELAVYELTVAKGGPKMTVTANQPSDGRNFLYRNLGDLRVSNASMKDFCDGMQGSAMDKPVVDHTGLTDRYDFTLKWTPDDSQFAQFGPRPPQKESDDPNAPPSLFTALQEQLGLKMDATKAMADAFVIDHVEKPGAN